MTAAGYRKSYLNDAVIGSNKEVRYIDCGWVSFLWACDKQAREAEWGFLPPVSPFAKFFVRGICERETFFLFCLIFAVVIDIFSIADTIVLTVRRYNCIVS